MFSKSEERLTPFTTFYEDNSILIQFILIEFLNFYQVKIQITSLIQQQCNDLLQTNTLVSSLADLLTQLVGELPHQEKSPSRWTKGSLTKLKEYCEHFSHNLNHNEKQHVLLYKAAHHAWISTMHSSQIISSWYRSMSNKNSENLLGIPSLKRIASTLQVRFNELMRYIPKAVSSYSNNENVILCLLKKKEQFAEIFGIDFLSKYFKLSLTVDQMWELLIERYRERGLEGFISTILEIQEKKTEVYAPS